MGKQQKQHSKPAATVETIVASTFEESLQYLQQQIRLVISGKAAKTKHDPAYRVATLTRMVAQVAAEKRKADSAEAKRLEKITRPLAMAWLRSISKEERRSVVREALAMDQEGNILA